MKTIYDLNENELQELRQNYFSMLCDSEGGTEYDSADEIPMKEVMVFHEDISFTEEDFMCSVKD